ncbi:hypothetical protein D9758_013736 [Tetrapyrgos nigripes]|uniref:Uncharacterized protein n=1 Tax=Tetrapyrgos nigripes TaxID=182062 RepID=A0A8H5LFX4_9AGAR|nr:hypothetical protein D9758_013736 [Tetrapyrgos nigripes]
MAGEVKRISKLARGQTSSLRKEDFDGRPGKTCPHKGATLTVSNVGAIRHTGARPVLVPGGGVAIVAVGRARWEWDADPAYDDYHDRDTLDAASLGFDANPESGLLGTIQNGLGWRRVLLPISFSADHRVLTPPQEIHYQTQQRPQHSQIANNQTWPKSHLLSGMPTPALHNLSSQLETHYASCSGASNSYGQGGEESGDAGDEVRFSGIDSNGE